MRYIITKRSEDALKLLAVKSIHSILRCTLIAAANYVNNQEPFEIEKSKVEELAGLLYTAGWNLLPEDHAKKFSQTYFVKPNKYHLDIIIYDKDPRDKTFDEYENFIARLVHADMFPEGTFKDLNDVKQIKIELW